MATQTQCRVQNTPSPVSLVFSDYFNHTEIQTFLIMVAVNIPELACKLV